MPARRLFLLAVWFGLLAGLLEIAVVQLALRSGVPVRLSADYVWMAPAANVGFAIIGLLAVLLLCRWRRRDATSLALGWLTTLLVLSVAFNIETLHRGAVLLLAVGIGSQAARAAGYPRARRLFVLVPATTLGMALLVAYLGFTLRRGLARQEAGTLAALPAAPAGAMNLLLLILDTVREESTGLGNPALTTTPVLNN